MLDNIWTGLTRELYHSKYVLQTAGFDGKLSLT